MSCNESGMKDTEPLKMFKVYQNPSNRSALLHACACMLMRVCTYIHTNKKPKANKKLKITKNFKELLVL